jgi:hypothetical protein
MEKSRVLYSLCWHLTFLLLGHSSLAQTGKPVATVENVFIEYEGKTVKAKKLTVRSEIPISIDTAWQNVQTPALLQYVAKGMISFRSKKRTASGVLAIRRNLWHKDAGLGLSAIWWNPLFVHG